MISLIDMILVVLVVVALGAAALVFLRLRALERRLADLERGWQDTVSQFRSLVAGSVGQGRHLAQVEEDLARLRHQLEQVSSQEGGDAAYSQAIRLARRGAAAEQLVDTCGLSRMEADLVVLLHRRASAE